MDCPDPVNLMPRPVVTEHYESWISRRKLEMIQPIRGAMNDLQLSGARVDREHRHRYPLFKASVHSDFFLFGERERLPIGSDRRLSRRLVAGITIWRPGGARRQIAFDPGAHQQCLIGVERGD